MLVLGPALVVHHVYPHHSLQEVVQRWIALWFSAAKSYNYIVMRWDIKTKQIERLKSIETSLPGSRDTTKSGAKMLFSISPNELISPPLLYTSYSRGIWINLPNHPTRSSNYFSHNRKTRQKHAPADIRMSKPIDVEPPGQACPFRSLPTVNGDAPLH